MYQMSIIAGLAAILILPTGQAELPNEEPRPIPLDQIWAIRMPGTRDIEKLDPDRPLVLDIRRAIGFPPKDKEGKPAFAVQGTGLDALRAAHAVFVDTQRPRETFSLRGEVSVVFFTYETGPYVHLHKVERQGNNINIYYRFVPHETEESTRYFGLIPLGKLKTGKYQVNINQAPMEQKYLDLGFKPVSEADARRIVCRSFSFTAWPSGD